MSLGQGSPEALAAFEKAAEELADLPTGNELLDSLRPRAILCRSLGQPSLEEFVMRRGQAYTPEPLGDLQRMEPQQCFRNAALLVNGDPERLRYVEGFACRPGIAFAIHHAWVTRVGEAVAIDPTWDDAIECLYWGMEFDIDYVLAVGERYKHMGETLAAFANETAEKERAG